MPTFSHLHVHTQYSLLDGQASVKALVKKAKADGMPALAITDHGNMFGAFDFVNTCDKEGIKPIVGCEFYMVEDRHRKQFNREAKDVRYHQLMLAKDQEGYKNLSKLCSLGFLEGMYSKYPRIDKELVLKYHKGLIATTCCIGAEVPQLILNRSEEEAETAFRWWLDLFGEDYYVELQRHGLPEQEQVNAVLLRFAAKYNVKIICSNDSHYVNREDSVPHDILLCVNTGELASKPKGDGPGMRFGFSNDEFYFKTQAEMEKVFHDLPQALDFTNEIVDKVQPLKLKRDPLLPAFPLPPGFTTNDQYLRALTYDGAEKRYGNITDEVRERLDFELGIIEKMGYAGYFLIVQDFIRAGRDTGVFIGPGRGSAAGSAVAYCVGITNIDPIKYSLLFERFLNPERVSMPDIDIDFDDEGRESVIKYVIDKYGKNQVAQIITYGTMGAKSAIKDVARVLDLPLAEANLMAKLIPDELNINLKDSIAKVPELQEIQKSDDLKGEVLRQAIALEGSIRSTGLHAAGVIIAPDDLTEYIPVCTAKDSDMMVSQFDKDLIESAGMLKMDFLGLKTLTIIRDAIKNIQRRHGILIDIDEIPLDDPKTYELYQRGDTVGTFQFESDGMRTYLRDLKPTNIEDLIAMNALYRPGPMQFIPNFINRKHGREVVEYPHDLLEPILNYSNGIMVYQEQIMQAAQILAGYSLGGADLLRRAMGKKDKEKMAKERVKFVEGAGKLHGISAEKASEVFDVMEKFAEYGFNRSHSAAYSVVAYQTAYLKANYPAEYMASVLTHNMGNIEKITFFLEECRRMELQVLGPDINESQRTFSVNAEGQIRFGMAAIKGIGDGTVEAILMERDDKGPFSSPYEFVSRVNLRSVNRKNLEALAQSGALDCFKHVHRAVYFSEEGGSVFSEKLMRYGAAVQADKDNSQASLFGGAGDNASTIAEPKVPVVEPWGDIEKLKYEKDVVGFYISGHPLDQFKLELDSYCTHTIDQLPDLKNVDVSVAGIVTKKTVRTNKSGNPFCIFVIEDMQGSGEMALFGKDYLNFQGFIEEGRFLYIQGKMQPRFGSADQQEFKPSKMELLQEIRGARTKAVVVNLPLDKINEERVMQLEQLTTQHPGGTDLMFYLVDREEGINLRMKSMNRRVSPSNELIDHIREMGLEVKLM